MVIGRPMGKFYWQNVGESEPCQVSGHSRPTQGVSAEAMTRGAEGDCQEEGHGGGEEPEEGRQEGGREAGSREPLPSVVGSPHGEWRPIVPGLYFRLFRMLRINLAVHHLCS